MFDRARQNARQATSAAVVMTEVSVNVFRACQTLKVPSSAAESHHGTYRQSAR